MWIRVCLRVYVCVFARVRVLVCERLCGYMFVCA